MTRAAARLIATVSALLLSTLPLAAGQEPAEPPAVPKPLTVEAIYAHGSLIGHPPDQLAWSNTIYVADTDKKAIREAKPHLEALVNYLLKMPTEMLLPPGYSDTASVKRIRAVKVTGKVTTIDDLVKSGVVIIGSPETVREKLAEYQDLAGFNTSLTKTQFGTMPNEMARANMTAIAEEILPAFRDRLPQGAARVAAE